jgi:polyisoprenyl-phosphate glycosyltransferase
MAAQPAIIPVEEQDLDATVVLPVFNEEGHLLEEVDRIDAGLRNSPYSYEILIIDDGSTDGTGEILDGLEGRPGIRIIRLGVNRGSGYARKVGTRAARGEVVVWTDADMTYPNDRMADLVDELGGYEQVVGARTSEQGTHRWARVPAKWFIRRLAMYLTQTDIPDLNSGFRAFRRDVALPYLHLLPTGFSCVTTITMAFLANGHPVKYVPIDYEQRAGESKFHWRRDTGRYLLQVVRMIMTFNPLRVFLPIGGLLLLAAFGKTVYDVIDKDFRISSNAVILTIVSLQIVATGLIADLVARTSGNGDRHR